MKTTQTAVKNTVCKHGQPTDRHALANGFSHMQHKHKNNFCVTQNSFA